MSADAFSEASFRAQMSRIFNQEPLMPITGLSLSRPLVAPALMGIDHVEGVCNPVFIADLHLSGKSKRTLLSFWWFLKTRARRFDELFILGDFFEYWIGDDACSPAEPIAKALRSYAAAGRRIFLMQGNRDFMMGEDFARHCAAELLKTQAVIEVRGRRILLSHGDEWCTLDDEYQAFRRQVRDPAFQVAGLEMSVEERIAFAKEARAKSAQTKTVKTPEMMDVVNDSVEADCRRWNVQTVIHGHTHKPARHDCGTFERFVLPDWNLHGEHGIKPRRGWIELDADGRPQIVIRHGVFW